MDKVISMIGLATKAGKTVSGEFSVEKAIQGNKAHAVIVSVEHRIIQRRSLKINVNITKYRCFIMEQHRT